MENYDSIKEYNNYENYNSNNSLKMIEYLMEEAYKMGLQDAFNWLNNK